MAVAFCCLIFNACEDNTFDEFNPAGGAEQGLVFTVNLPRTSEANLSSRGTEGDAIKDIENNLHIYIYDENGDLLHHCGREGFVNTKYDKSGNTAYPGYPYRKPEMNRYRADMNYPAESTPEENSYWENFRIMSAEQTTPCYTFGVKDFKPESGKTYQICATANVDVPASDFQTIEALKNYSVTWNKSNIAKNAQMFGMFSTDREEVEGSPIKYVAGVTTELHAWLVRCASKVTVSFNTTQLNDDVWIYLHNVTIRNVPKNCHLRYGNKAAAEADVEDRGESILYAPDGSNYANAATEFQNWPVLTKGTGQYGSDHSETAEALFFYENLQGEGKDKNQQDSDAENNNSGSVSYPDSGTEGEYGWRDEKPYGTYIEVEAYYRSDVRGNEGKGRIIYRFQLGLDTFKDYNAFRNHHFKLTLNFRGNANDTDWHIDYQPDTDSHIYVPHPFYISYMHGEQVEMPVTIDGKLTKGTKIIAEIVENNWKPLDGSPSIYWNGAVYSSEKFKYDGPWHGFLTLRPTNYSGNPAGHEDIPNSQAIGRQKTLKDIDGFKRAYLMSYWYGGYENMTGIADANASNCYSAAELEANEGMFIPQQGYREYDTTNRNGVTTDNTKDNVDSYEIIEKQIGNQYRTHVYLPLYTRALFMVKTFGYSGANPYFGRQRKAVLKITCWVDEPDGNGGVKSVQRTQLCDIIQVRRVINPSGIYRDIDDNKSFTVKLSRRISEISDTFMPFTSDGKWSAEIESGDAGFITLNGKQKIFGSTGDFMNFQVHFIPSNQKKNRYAVILVKYHDYTCKHRILVRQGYEPDALFDGGVKWHSVNLRGGEKECESPIDPGSLFRFGNLEYGIDASTNVYEQLGVDPGSTPFPVVDKNGNPAGSERWYKNNITNYPLLGSGKPTLDFQTIASTNYGGSQVNFGKNFTLYDNGKQTNEGKTTRLPKYDDWKDIRDNRVMNYCFGICYDGNSTVTAMTGDYAYNYCSSTGKTNGHGMRGFFAYNTNDARNMFLPVGASGYGRRKGGSSGEAGGALRYANRSVYMPTSAVSKLPMFWNIKDNSGAIYWSYPDNTNRVDVWNGDAITNFTAWDINLTTYDFNHFSSNAYIVSKNDYNNSGKKAGSDFYFSDACCIRLVDE